MLAKFCSELQRLHSDVIETREKCHSIGVKVHDAHLDEHHLEHKYFYQELLQKNTFHRITYAPKIVKDKLFLKFKQRILEDNKKLFIINDNIKSADVKVVYW